MGGLLKGKKVMVTGVLDRRSIAFSAARLASEQGAEVALSSFGRAMNLTARTAKRLDPEPPILELDVNKPEDIDAVAKDLAIDPKLVGIFTAIIYAVAAVLALFAAGPIVRLGAVRVWRRRNQVSARSLRQPVIMS